jgi:hypothetical protein
LIARNRVIAGKRTTAATPLRVTCAILINIPKEFLRGRNVKQTMTYDLETTMVDLVKNIEEKTRELADAVAAEQALEDARINAKLAAIERIMKAGDNPLTNKPHSFSSAEAMVNTDEQYQSYLEQQRHAVRRRILAKGAYDAAKAAARFGADSLV